MPEYEPPKKKRALRFVRKPGSSDFGGRTSPSQLILADDATTPVRSGAAVRDPLYAQAELMLGMLAAPVKTPSVSKQPDTVKLRSRADTFEEDEEDEGDYTDYDDDEEFDDDAQPIGGLSALRNATALHTPEKFRKALSLVAAAAGSSPH
jgi:hypothetical protein